MEYIRVKNDYLDYIINYLKQGKYSTLSISSNISLEGEKLLHISFFGHVDEWMAPHYLSYYNGSYATASAIARTTTWYNLILSKKIDPRPYDTRAYGWVSGVSIEGEKNINSANRIEVAYTDIPELGMELETILDTPTVEWDKVGFFD